MARANVVQAVTLARPVEEAVDCHSRLAMAELAGIVVAEAAARTGACGAGQRPAEREERGYDERQRSNQDDLVYPESHWSPVSAASRQRASRQARQAARN
jgi:hypothetical protein